MRKLLIGSAAVLGAAFAASPAASQIYVGLGYSPYSYGYSNYYSPYSYGYSNYYSPYSYGYSNYYSPYSYRYSTYGYSYPYSTRSYYRTRSYYGCRLRRHHRNGVVYYTRDC
jgi:hypothetical protein